MKLFVINIRRMLLLLSCILNILKTHTRITQKGTFTL